MEVVTLLKLEWNVQLLQAFKFVDSKDYLLSIDFTRNDIILETALRIRPFTACRGSAKNWKRYR